MTNQVAVTSLRGRLFALILALVCWGLLVVVRLVASPWQPADQLAAGELTWGLLMVVLLGLWSGRYVDARQLSRVERRLFVLWRRRRYVELFGFAGTVGTVGSIFGALLAVWKWRELTPGEAAAYTATLSLVTGALGFVGGLITDTYSQAFTYTRVRREYEN